nr:hypothetical protein [Candidatus Aenigmarchaeota archaeon]
IELFGKKISLMLVYVCHFGLLVFSIVSSIMNCNWNWFLLYVIIMGYIITCIMVGIFVMDVYHKCLSWRMKKREGKEAITERSMVGESHEN